MVLSIGFIISVVALHSEYNPHTLHCGWIGSIGGLAARSIVRSIIEGTHADSFATVLAKVTKRFSS
jgi:hypothetical protein